MRVEKEPADQGRFAVIDVSDKDEGKVSRDGTAV
jgi:hypothetical protein